jgi:S-formylglutathione hydrolase
MTLETLASTACFGGTHGVYRHRSRATGTAMEFCVYQPPRANDGPCPVVTYLSGLACTWENAATKAGAQRVAAELGLILVFPDTSPRGPEVANDPGYDLGQGAGFYLDATEAPWAPHFKMESYVAEELPAVIAANFPVDAARQGLTGHSMGGHGALTLALRHPGRWRSLSAFAPIVAPASVPWGEKAFTAYLGPDRDRWLAHDATALIAERGYAGEILVDQGLADQFLAVQLQPERLALVCEAKGVALTLRQHAGYDHAYWFVQSFIPDHLAWHAARL